MPSAARSRASIVVFALVSSACAPSTTLTRDPGVVMIPMPDGAPLEIRRGVESIPNQPVALPPERVWALLDGVYEDMGVEVDLRDPTALQLGSSTHRISRRFMERNASDFFECGVDPGLNRPLADQAPITASIVTQVIPFSGGSQLRTVVGAVARRPGGAAGTATCTSTGVIEAVIAQLVERAAARSEGAARLEIVGEIVR
jgi:hypothetical protein